MSLNMTDLVCCIARSVLIASSFNLHMKKKKGRRGGGGRAGEGGGMDMLLRVMSS